MRTGLSSAIILSLSCMIFSTEGVAADGNSGIVGKQEFEDKCAACHGIDGKGRGVVAEFLKTAPPDLTMLTKKNGGVFPYMHVEAMIDGREIVKVHGERNMPVWGRDLLKENSRAKEFFADRRVDMELYVHLRILALMDYLNRIQEK